MIDDGRIQGGRRRFVWQDERDGDGWDWGQDTKEVRY